MRNARQISAREVSHGVQRHVLAQTTWFGSTVMAYRGAAPLVFERLTTRFRPAVHGRGRSRIAVTVPVTVPWKTWARMSYLMATACAVGIPLVHEEQEVDSLHESETRRRTAYGVREAEMRLSGRFVVK